MKGLKELMEAKGKKVDPARKQAKMGVLGDLKKMATGMMGDDIKGLKKVTVAAPDEEGLAKGLEKAEELIGAEDESEEESEEDEVDALCADKSPEEIDAVIKKLEEKKLEMEGSMSEPEML